MEAIYYRQLILQAHSMLFCLGSCFSMSVVDIAVLTASWRNLKVCVQGPAGTAHAADESCRLQHHVCSLPRFSLMKLLWWQSVYHILFSITLSSLQDHLPINMMYQAIYHLSIRLSICFQKAHQIGAKHSELVPNRHASTCMGLRDLVLDLVLLKAISIKGTGL